MNGSELKAGARRLIFDNAPKLLIISTVFVIIVTVMSELQFRLPGTALAYDRFLERLRSGELPSLGMFYSNLRVSGVVLAAIIFMLRPIMDVGFISYCIKMTRGLGGDYYDIFNGFVLFIKVLMVFIITTVLQALWSMLFVLPGIAAYYRYRQSYYILLDAPEKGVIQCIRESKQLMSGNKLDLFLVDLSFAGWFLLDFFIALTLSFLSVPVAIPIVSLWLTPYMGLTHAAYYNRLLGRITV